MKAPESTGLAIEKNTSSEKRDHIKNIIRERIRRNLVAPGAREEAIVVSASNSSPETIKESAVVNTAVDDKPDKVKDEQSKWQGLQPKELKMN